MISQFLKLFRKDYRTLNRIEISRDDLIQNYRYLSSLNRKIKIAPVLKSNAYGHGAVLVAKILDNIGTPFICVDSLYEAYELYKAKIKTPILIMGYTDPQNFKVKKLPFSYAVFDLETARVLNKYQPNCGIHIFADTGMNREGISLYELPQFLTHLKQFKNLKIEGLMSHLAMAEKPHDSLTKKQVNNFPYVQQIVRKAGFKPKWIHISNSSGLLNLPYVSIQHKPVVGNLARVGLALYGISDNPNLKPVLALKSKIIQIKRLQKGDRVGYGGTYKAKKDVLLGVLPIGYCDGVDRRLSNKGSVLINGIVCPIIGRVSMNITTVDITKAVDPQVGQEVFVYSNNRTDKNSIENAAKICHTIPYDLLVHLTASTRRVIV